MQVNDVEERNALLKEKDGITKMIDALVLSHKKLQEDVMLKRKIVSTTKKMLKKIREGRHKSELTIWCNIEKILQQHNITPAEYHGGVLNGALSCRLMAKSKKVFQEIKDYLVSLQYIDKCSNDKIASTCETFSEIFAALNVLSSKLQMKHGEPKE